MISDAEAHGRFVGCSRVEYLRAVLADVGAYVFIFHYNLPIDLPEVRAGITAVSFLVVNESQVFRAL